MVRLDLVKDPVALASEELAAGRMVLLRDDSERRGEGDLLIAAEFADAAAVNFMATEARGLVCLALSTEGARNHDVPGISLTDPCREWRPRARFHALRGIHYLAVGQGALDPA